MTFPIRIGMPYSLSYRTIAKRTGGKNKYFMFVPQSIKEMDVQIEASWKEILKSEFNKPYFQQIVLHLKTEKTQGKIIYPPGPLIFNAFNTTPIDKVKVVILGQDPYHGPGQAHGLCFSVPNGIPQPPSLVNIFKELHEDIGIPIPKSGNLTHWAEQGVFLLNASLTVRAGEPMSHSRIGWAEFTDCVIRKISELKQHVVFLLWGKFAQEKRVLIDESKHLVLKAAHPSPLSVHAGFFGCRHFSKTNDYLMKNGIDPIDWKL
ncbi:MAG TPA: uracil-DNA glycosylase [Chitinophagaceae bacterium]|nr:uracil-DNA glycosylase [Chitinophagaceae bacterium]